MIEETGTVVEARPGRALVQTERGAACEGCAARGACSHLGGSREARVWVLDPLGATPGERVVLAVPERAVMRASFWVYLVPVAALVGGALVGNAAGPRMGIGADAGAALIGLGAMGVALAASRFAGRKAAEPRIVRRA